MDSLGGSTVTTTGCCAEAYVVGVSLWVLDDLVVVWVVESAVDWIESDSVVALLLVVLETREGVGCRS